MIYFSKLSRENIIHYLNVIRLFTAKKLQVNILYVCKFHNFFQGKKQNWKKAEF